MATTSSSRPRVPACPMRPFSRYGGKTAAHDIVAVKAKALAFLAHGAQHFAKSVHHPGSVIRAYRLSGGPLDEILHDMEERLTSAVLRTLGEE